MISVFAKHKNSVVKRCENDETTRLRLKYNPYYHTFDRQEGAHVWEGDKEFILMCSNDYLGLGGHPKLIEAGQQALAKWGSSSTGARLANGSRAYHRDLEEKLAAFIGKEACHVSVAGYISCMSSIQPFAQKDDLILADRNVHSSLWAGIGLTQAKVERFGHNNPTDLKEIISYENPKKPKIVVFEGVYSMEGHIGRVDEIVDVCREHNCFYIMDDAHGFGVMGEQGRGTANHFGLTDEIDVICGSFSKSLSSTGGFIAASRDVIEYMRTHSKQTIFSAALSPAMAATASTALDLLQEDATLHERLWRQTKRYKERLTAMGYNIWDSQTPAVPVVMGNRERAYRMWELLMENGVFTALAIAPAVPPGKDLIRTAISLRHTDEDIDRVCDVFAAIAKRI